MDVVEWLHGLGLEQYAPAFRDNDIDGEVLRRLTGEDLRELGVTSIGHRRRLLDSIASLGDRQRTREELPASAPAAAGEAERRQLTVMFCDLVGSTALSTRFDPEDLREMIGAYHRCVANTVARFAGFVAKYMGDGVLIYFGYPQAHEDDAERAVRSGLAVIDAVGNLSAPERLNVRLGVASGLVVVGDLIGAGAAQERGVVGETPATLFSGGNRPPIHQPLLSVLLAVRRLPVGRLAVGLLAVGLLPIRLLPIRLLPIRLLPIRLLPVMLLAVGRLAVTRCCHNRAATLRAACEVAFDNTVIVPNIPDATLKPSK
jgi:class 3 adenylate cyclase